MRFQDAIQDLNQEYVFDDVIDYVNLFCETHVELAEKYSLQGAYHVWENGFEQGDANGEDVLRDARRLDCVKGDFDDTLQALLNKLDTLFLELYEQKLMALVEAAGKMIEDAKAQRSGSRAYIRENDEGGYIVTFHENEAMPAYASFKADTIEEIMSRFPGYDWTDPDPDEEISGDIVKVGK